MFYIVLCKWERRNKNSNYFISMPRRLFYFTHRYFLVAVSFRVRGEEIFFPWRRDLQNYVYVFKLQMKWELIRPPSLGLLPYSLVTYSPVRTMLPFVSHLKLVPGFVKFVGESLHFSLFIKIVLRFLIQQ